MSETRRKHNIIERITFGFGLISLFAIIGFLIFDMNNSKRETPQLQIKAEYDASVKPNGYKIIVENSSKQTAADAQISFGLYHDGKLSNSATATFDFIPAKSQKTAWIVFYSDRNPSDSLVIQSVTFLQP